MTLALHDLLQAKASMFSQPISPLLGSLGVLHA